MHRLLKEQGEHRRTHVTARAASTTPPVTAAEARAETALAAEAGTGSEPALVHAVLPAAVSSSVVMTEVMTVIVAAAVSPPLATYATDRFREGRPPVAESPGAGSKSTIY